MGGRHESLTDEQKKESLENAISTFRFLVENGFQGNITFPIYDKSVGKIHAELFLAPAIMPGLLNGKLKEGG